MFCAPAAANTGKREILGADGMFPILVLVLAYAGVPCIQLYLVESAT